MDPGWIHRHSAVQPFRELFTVKRDQLLLLGPRGPRAGLLPPAGRPARASSSLLVDSAAHGVTASETDSGLASPGLSQNFGGCAKRQL